MGPDVPRSISVRSRVGELTTAQFSDAVLSSEQIRFRLTAWQWLIPFLPVLLGTVVELVLRATEQPTPAAYALTSAEHHQVVLFNAIAIPIAAVLFVVCALETRWFGVTLTPTEARVHSVRRRTIRWSDVRAVTTENVLGTRVVVLYEENRRTRLRAPITGWLTLDRRFEQKYRTIGQWWLEHGGLVEQPLPEA